MLIITWEKLILILAILIAVFLLKTIIKIIKGIFRAFRFIFTGGKKREAPINSKDWLTRAQARQEIRFNNSLPPLRSESKPQKKTIKQKWNLKQGRSENGWTFNEETQLWEPPKNLKK